MIGAGKASAQMARAVERLLGARITRRPDQRQRRSRRGTCGASRSTSAAIRCLTARAWPARGASRKLRSQAGPDDLIICLISGGASALLPLPAPPITLAEKQKTTRLLLHCGASIHEINCVRKHISRIKGGQLARLAYPATLLTLILSDVIGDDLDVIGSGPTVPDRSTFADARAILEKYRIWNKLPPRAAADQLRRPKRLSRRQNLREDAQTSSSAATLWPWTRRRAKHAGLGFHTLVLSTFVEGEAREVARVHAAIAKEIRASGRPVRSPACVISGGETTVTIRGKGLGGRNQEFALAAAIDIAGFQRHR